MVEASVHSRKAMEEETGSMSGMEICGWSSESTLQVWP